MPTAARFTADVTTALQPAAPGRFTSPALSRLGEASDYPSDNRIRQHQTSPDAARHCNPPDLPVSDSARHSQTESAGMACKRSGVRIPIAPLAVYAVQMGVSEITPEPHFDLESRKGAKRGASGHADLVSFVWLKRVFMVVAPLVITGLSWCR